MASKCKITAVVDNATGKDTIDIRDSKSIPEPHPQEAARKWLLHNVTSLWGEQEPPDGLAGGGKHARAQDTLHWLSPAVSRNQHRVGSPTEAGEASHSQEIRVQNLG